MEEYKGKWGDMYTYLLYRKEEIQNSIDNNPDENNKGRLDEIESTLRQMDYLGSDNN